jgi:4-hydroxy-2-oxoheptanedioate aldolase
MLDMGCAGVIVPCVDTVEQARDLVFAAKFPPLGGRSYGSRRLVDLQGRLFVEQANARSLLIIQIETPLGITNAEKIAAIEGVDALFLGPDDVMLRRGFSMNTPRTPESLGADMREVVRACRKYNKKAVTIGIGPEMSRFTIDCGFDLIVGGGDVGFLATGSKKAADEMRAAAFEIAANGNLPGSLANPR